MSLIQRGLVFGTIQAAIDDTGTVAGDTILVGAGTISGADATNIHITKALTIRGAGTGSTFIEPTGNGFYVDSNDVVIEDLTIQNGSQAIRFESGGATIDNTTIRNVAMTMNSSRGIEVHNNTFVTNLLIEDSQFVQTNIGLRVSSSGHLDGVQILNSVFMSNDIGLYVANDGGSSTAKNVTIRGSTFQDHTTEWGSSGYAVYVEELQDSTIDGNVFVANGRDIEIFKWYQAAVEVSNVTITNNTMVGATNAVFAIFNAEHSSGRTVFNGVTFSGNTAVTTDNGLVRAVYAGGHSATTGSGGLGWETVHVNCNTFRGISTAGRGVFFYDPVAVDGDTLGGGVLDVTNNWWGSTDQPTIEALMTETAITTFEPFLSEAPTSSCPNPPSAGPEHFVCYQVTEKTHLPDQYVSLEDQFGEEENVRVKQTTMICAPADKNGEGVVDTESHLTCYHLQSYKNPKVDVLVSNQFGDQELSVKNADILCVPSLKEVLGPTPDPRKKWKKKKPTTTWNGFPEVWGNWLTD